MTEELLGVAALTSRRDVVRSLFGAAVGTAVVSAGGGSWVSALAHSAAGLGSGEESVQYRSGRVTIDGLFFPGAGPGPQKAVLLIHSVAGLNGAAKAFARRLAAEGFTTLAPDFGSRVKSGAEKTAVTHLDPELTVADAKAGYAFLKAHAGVDANAVSVIGLGWGGWRAFMLAESAPDVHRMVAYYGSTPTDGLERINAPMLAHYAENDFRVTGNVVWIDDTMKTLKKSFTYAIYEGAGTDFVTKPASLQDQSAAAASWTKTLAFLKA